ncbi:hypothetical protein BSKO_06082 [Bryopsis sp. KO-2023]|nr:hypothetical protein BSKO_06082 [Bryopsis sp. KO-2023]
MQIGPLNFAGKLAVDQRRVTTWDPLVIMPTMADFMDELHKWYTKETGEKLRVPVFSKKELDLAQLWSVVQEFGGSEKVCYEKRWAGIGRLFDPPKNMTNLSFHIKRLYEKHLLPFERAKFPERAMTTENEQINACRRRAPGDDYYQFDPVMMQPVRVSAPTQRSPPTSVPMDTPKVFSAGGLSFNKSLLELTPPSVIQHPPTLARVIGSSQLDMEGEGPAPRATTDGGGTSEEEGRLTTPSDSPTDERELIAAEQLQAMKRQRDSPVSARGRRSAAKEVFIEEGRPVPVLSTVSVEDRPGQLHGLKPHLAADSIAEADQVVKAKLLPILVPNRRAKQGDPKAAPPPLHDVMQRYLTEMKTSHAKEVIKLKREIEECRRKIKETETAQTVAAAVAEESRNCFQLLLQSMGVGKMVVNNVGQSRQGGGACVREVKRVLDRTESEPSSKRHRVVVHSQGPHAWRKAFSPRE